MNIILKTLSEDPRKSAATLPSPSPRKASKPETTSNKSCVGLAGTPTKTTKSHTVPITEVSIPVSPSPKKTGKSSGTSHKSLHVTTFTPLKSTVHGVLPDIMAYEITPRSPGYSKDGRILCLVKPFEVKKIC